MCQILDDGRQVFVDNPDPGFFDWSQVGRGADRIAFGLQAKVASADSPVWESSVDLAKHAGLWVPPEYAETEGLQRVYAKHAILKKLCEMEKEIETKLTPLDTKVKDSMVPEGIPEEDLPKLKKAGLPETMANLHSAQVVLPIKDFLKLVSDSRGADLDDVSEDVQNKLPGIFGRMESDEDKSPLENTAFDGDGPMGGPVGSLIQSLIPQLGMGQGPLGKRVTITVIRMKPKVASSRPISAEPEIETMARLYATYKLAALSHPKNADDVMLTRSALLQNYHHQA